MIHGIQSGINPQYLCLQNNFNVIPIASKYLTRYRNFLQGGTECGLYAIANVTNIAYGRDPSQLLYCEKEMCQHLLNCFSQKDLKPFPLINEESDNPNML